MAAKKAAAKKVSAKKSPVKKITEPEKLFTDVVKSGKSSVFVNVKKNKGSVYLSITGVTEGKEGKKNYNTINMKADKVPYFKVSLGKAQTAIKKALKKL